MSHPFILLVLSRSGFPFLSSLRCLSRPCPIVSAILPTGEGSAFAAHRIASHLIPDSSRHGRIAICRPQRRPPPPPSPFPPRQQRPEPASAANAPRPLPAAGLVVRARSSATRPGRIAASVAIRAWPARDTARASNGWPRRPAPRPDFAPRYLL